MNSTFYIKEPTYKNQYNFSSHQHEVTKATSSAVKWMPIECIASVIKNSWHVNFESFMLDLVLFLLINYNQSSNFVAIIIVTFAFSYVQHKTCVNCEENVFGIKRTKVFLKNPYFQLCNVIRLCTFEKL